MNAPLIFVINPGSTSTKLAFFEGQTQKCAQTVRYQSAELKQFSGIWDQFEFRMAGIRDWLAAQSPSLSAVAGIGGLVRPVQGGMYRVNDRMLADARANLQGEHASNLGCAMADAIAREYGCEAYVGDPVSVDELEPLARYSGHPLIQRSSLSHALNIHAAARRAASALGSPLAATELVVAHLGGGISVAPVRGGKIIDVNDANSDGPFSPERTGGLPLQQVIALCYSGRYLRGGDALACTRPRRTDGIPWDQPGHGGGTEDQAGTRLHERCSRPWPIRSRRRSERWQPCFAVPSMLSC